MPGTSAVVSQKGWIVIPKEIRERHGLKPGTRVHILEYAGVIMIGRVPDDPIAEGRGIIKGEPSATRELLEERRREREREDAR